MASLKLAYVGGGSTRAPGTVASLLERADGFAGSEVVLIDLDEDRLALVRRFAEQLAKAKGASVRFSSTTDRRAGLADCDAVLTAFRPGGFQARAFDERIPLKHDVIGQETQGPGGFFMALRSVHIMRAICSDIEEVCPAARIFNYTNPVNIVSQAVATNSGVPIMSFCEGPIVFPRFLAEAAGLDPEELDVTMVGVNHNCWSVRHEYKGMDLIAVIKERYEDRMSDPRLSKLQRRMLRLATMMEAVPSEYFQYYYFGAEILRELKAKPTTRSEDILAKVPDYWQHYRQQAESDHPELDPKRSRGGIHELELALDAMDAFYNDKGSVLPVNIMNTGGVAAGFDESVVVELPCRVDKSGFTPVPQPALKPAVRGLVEMLAEYQVAAAEAAWSGDRKSAIRALVANPLVGSVAKGEALYDEMAHALADYLPERLR
jgi:6-phospho-beta-glucosidase